ncbi:MAG: homoserine O-acetyltransferase [Actinomycetota bacterium]
MEFQVSGDSIPSDFITDELARKLIGKPPASGAWRDGDPVGDRKFTLPFALELESGKRLENIKIAYESWGELNQDKSNAVLVLHALTGDSHAFGSANRSHKTAGWWNGVIGPGLAIDTNKYFVVAPNMLGGCQGSTGPSSLDKKGKEYGARFPYLTIRDQVLAQKQLSDFLGINRWKAIIGGSMGGMQVLEWGIMFPKAMDKIAVLAAPAFSNADQIALNSVQIEAIKADPLFEDGDYYDAAAGKGPYRGLALARRMALLNYRSPEELNIRFARSWQSKVNPFGDGGRFAVESYLDFHGNKFTRRFDANSYLTLVEAMNSHDIGRGRGSVKKAISKIKAEMLLVGIESDRLFPVANQQEILKAAPKNLFRNKLFIISSDFGHDGFLIEADKVGRLLKRFLTHKS